MRRAPRGSLLLALATTAFCLLPQPARGTGIESDEAALDYATVGRVVTRFVDGRVVIVVPVAGVLRPDLSEPIRAGRRWRLDLVLEDARLAIDAPARKGEGLAALSVREVGNDVRITVEVNRLGDYGTRRSEEGLLMWIDAERREPVPPLSASTPTSIPVTGSAAAPAPVSVAQTPPARPVRRNWVGWIGLVIAAAAAGGAVRSVRRNGWPDWVVDLRSSIASAVRERIGGREPVQTAAEPAAGGEGAAGKVPFGNGSSDSRGRSVEIGDAFRVQPEKPASGIAALVTTNENDAE